MIRTVLGDISGDALGHTQCHEHLFIEKGKASSINPALCMTDEDKTVSELNTYRMRGGRSIVDAQPIYSGRMAGALVDASCRSGVHIIAATGFHKAMFYEDDSPIFTDSAQKLADAFVSDLFEGMLDGNGQRLNAKAGILKAAMDEHGSNKTYEKLFEAVISAALQTPVPILIHTDPNTDVLSLIRRFMDAGIWADRIIVSHLCRTRYDFGYHREVLSSGAYLCYDSVNRLKYLSHEAMIALIQNMLTEGYEDQLLLSLDTTNQRLRAYGADMGLDYILQTFRPMLLSHGITEDAIQRMTVANAAKALALR